MKSKYVMVWYVIGLTLLMFGAASSARSAAVSGQGTWESTLHGRDLNGDGAVDAYYDATLDITWLADANFSSTAGFDSDGRMTWAVANAWVDNLNIGGAKNWRLPIVSPIDGSTFNTEFSNNATTDNGYADSDGWVDGSGSPVSEMGHMYYVTLGNLGGCTPNDADPDSCVIQSGGGLSNTGPFSNIQDDDYWTDTELNLSDAWGFEFVGGGVQGHFDKDFTLYAWAVHPGDAIVPVPAAIWLFGSGLIGLIGFAKMKVRFN